MNWKNCLVAAIIALEVTACKTTLLKQYAVGEPKVESLETVRNALERYSPSYREYLCVFRDSAALVEWFRHSNLPGRSQFYNADGFRIITQDSTFCSGVETDFAGRLKINQAYRTDTLSRFEDLKACLLPAGDKVSLEPSKYTFTCVIFWAKFMGRINEASFRIAEAALNSKPAKEGKVNLVFVDMDIMDFWNVSQNMIKTQTRTR